MRPSDTAGPPLHGAAQNGSLATVERLLAAGADADARNDDGVDALQLARNAGDEAIASHLATVALTRS